MLWRMDRVSKPLLGLLVGTVVFFALWIIALKPSSSATGGGSSSGGLGQYNSAISAAHNAVATADAASAAHGGTLPPGSPTTSRTASAPAATVAASAAKTASAPAATATHTAAATASRAAPHAHARHRVTVTRGLSPAQREALVVRALRAHHVVAVLFFNPAGADDRQLTQELAAVPTHRARVVKVAAPLGELARYPAITAQVPISGSPTLVIVDRTGVATTLVGFADRFEIAQLVDDALAAPA